MDQYSWWLCITQCVMLANVAGGCVMLANIARSCVIKISIACNKILRNNKKLIEDKLSYIKSGVRLSIIVHKSSKQVYPLARDYFRRAEIML